jgi:hypothetical protein
MDRAVQDALDLRSQARVEDVLIVYVPGSAYSRGTRALSVLMVQASTRFHPTEANSIPATNWEGFTGTLSKANPAAITAGTSLDGPRALGGTGRIHNCATGQSSLRPGNSGSSQASRGVRMCLGGQAVVEQPRLGEHLRVRRRVGVEADNRRDRL